MKLRLLALFLALSPFGVSTEFVHYPTRAAAEKSLAGYFGPRSYVNNTGSMMPVLRGKEILVLDPITWPARKGELLIFRQAHDATKTTVHRVVEDNGRAVFMSGDANRHSDGWIERACFVWRVKRVVTWAD